MGGSGSYKAIMGDLPELLDLKISDIPHLGSDTLRGITNLYSEIVWYTNELLYAYITLGLSKARYIDFERFLENIDDYINDEIDIYDLEGEIYSVVEASFPDLGIPMGLIDRFEMEKKYMFFWKLPKNKEEALNQEVFELLLIMLYPRDNYSIGLDDLVSETLIHMRAIYSKQKGQDFVETTFKDKIDEYIQNVRLRFEKYSNSAIFGSKEHKFKVSTAVVLHPLFLNQDSSFRVDNIKKHAESEGVGIVGSIQELLSKYLGVDISSLNEEWERMVETVTNSLEISYKFLRFRKYPTLYKEAKRDIEEARALSTISEITKKGRIDIITQIGRGTEKLLKALHLLESNEEPGKMTFDGFLTKNRDKIIYLFGEDVFTELQKIQAYRNKVSHSDTDVNIPMLDLIKIANYAHQFLQLFRIRYVEKYTNLD